MAWETASRDVVFVDAPPVRFGGGSHAMSPLPGDRAGISKTAPLLDQLFAGEKSASNYVHRRSDQLDLGITTIGIEALRLQTNPADRFADRRNSGERSKSWSLAARSDWSIGPADHLSFGLAATTEHSAQPLMLAAEPHIATLVRTFGLTWMHGARWQMSAGWQETTGNSRSEEDRMVELASGAPLHEKGMHISLAFTPGEAGDPRRTSLGMEARAASVSHDDLALIGSNRGQDTQACLFLRTHFW